MFYFLEEQQGRQRAFTLEELAEATGYKLSSIRTYYGKRLKGTLVSERADGRFRAHGLSVFDADGFVDYMTQRSSPEVLEDMGLEDERAPGPAGDDTVIAGMLERAAHTLRASLAAYHDPYDPGRLARCVGALAEAWTLLLSAELAGIRGVDAIYVSSPRPKRGGGRPLTLPELVARFFPDVRDAERRNIEWVSALGTSWRDAMVVELQPYVSRLLPASGLNFRRRYEAVARRKLLRMGSGLMSLVIDEDPVDPSAFHVHLGAHAARRALTLLEELRREEAKLADESFSATSELRLTFSRVDPSQPMELSDGAGSRRAARALEATLEHQLYPFDPLSVVLEINARLPFARRLSTSAIGAIDAAHGVRDEARTPLYLRTERAPYHLYSRAYVEWVVQCMTADERWFEDARMMSSARRVPRPD